MNTPVDFSAPAPSASANSNGAAHHDGQTAKRSDVGNAEKLIELHGNDLRFVGTWSRWMIWDGCRWVLDDVGGVQHRAIATARVLYDEALALLADAEETEDDKKIDRAKGGVGWAVRSQSAARLSAMVTVASSTPSIAITHNDLDADPLLLNVANGTIDLRTGKLRPHRRENLCSKLAPVTFDPDAPRPRFERFMSEVTKNDPDLLRFLKCFLGYCLTGETREHIFAFWHGSGGNGKSVLANLMMQTMGDYAIKTMPDLVFRSEGSEKHETELCDLHSRRLAFSNETKQGRTLDDGRIKDLTGADPIRARRMREDSWQWNPTHKLVLFGQHKPTLKTVDAGMKRRTKLVPFSATFEGEKNDKGLKDKLLAEASGALAFFVEGCLEWQKTGIPSSAAVDVATTSYFKEEDTLGQFFDAECVFVSDAKVTRKDLRDHYLEWCKGRDEKPVSSKDFAAAVRERGAVDRKVRDEHGPRHGWHGIRLLAKDEADARDAEQTEIPCAP